MSVVCNNLPVLLKILHNYSIGLPNDDPDSHRKCNTTVDDSSNAAEFNPSTIS